jgi:Raf kinase inhibitor-like YbhB/YbcL family protein
MAIFGVEVRVDMANNSAEFGALGQVEIVSKLGERIACSGSAMGPNVTRESILAALVVLASALSAQQSRRPMTLHVSSSAFSEGKSIPQNYTCDGQNVSPPLTWTGAPTNTRSFVIIADDPDAPSGTFTHWVLYDLPAGATELKEAASGGGKEGVNDFGKKGYGGPCPPPDGPHRYFFHVYALDRGSLGSAGLSKQGVTAAMKGHILAEGQLVGTYRRKR